jgi:cytochrome b pre-mRNA-processing protein 3
MNLLPFRHPTRDPSIATLYGTIVAQARSPIFYFYRGYGVPDTVAGRFDMIVLHLVLFLQRLKHESTAVQSLGQDVFNFFCRDMDDNFREMGVGDLAVPKEMRKVGEAFYGRTAAYEAALAIDDDEALVAALTRNIFGDPALGARRLAAYTRETMRQLKRQDDFERNGVKFPNPDIVTPDDLEESA